MSFAKYAIITTKSVVTKNINIIKKQNMLHILRYVGILGINIVAKRMN